MPFQKFPAIAKAEKRWDRMRCPRILALPGIPSVGQARSGQAASIPKRSYTHCPDAKGVRQAWLQNKEMASAQRDEIIHVKKLADIIVAAADYLWSPDRLP
ncbi:hypothetical protein B0H12DRAFT_43651 [Mycena haematopus]|nr:hypothetical protein B0H12DRAFT_43651 [Mycena haematopus]